MSTSKLDTSGVFRPLVLLSPQTQLHLSPGSVCVRKNGIEFRSNSDIPLWTEMTVDLELSHQSKSFQCTGVVVACQGNRHEGFAVSMIFMNLSPQLQERLHTWSFSPLA